LITVPTTQRRQALLRQATRQEWSAEELESRIRREASRSGTSTLKAQERLTPARGAVGLFRIKEIEGARYWDLGFESYRELSSTQARRFKAGELVRLSAAGDLQPAPDATPTDLYTYEARVLRVIDGDTLLMLIRLAGADWRRETLRLRGIDCPERDTAAGASATRYVQAQLHRAAQIVISTTKPDQWDRYLSDLFLLPAEGETIFLNNRLLETGHARRYEASSLKDWGEESSR